MADNTTRAVTSGGDTIRDVDRSGVKTQVSLLDISQSGDAELLGVGDTRPVSATSAGLTTSVTAYVAGDQLGTELTFSGITRTGKGVVVQSAVLLDKANIIGAVDLLLFSAATTPAADNAANAWSDADWANLLGVIHFTDVVSSANNRAGLASNCPVALKPGSGTSIFGDLVTRTGHTFFGATTDLIVALEVLRD